MYTKLYDEYINNKIDINEYRERLFKLNYKEPEIPEDLSYYTLENIENDLNVIKLKDLDNLNQSSIKNKKLLGRKYDVIDQSVHPQFWAYQAGMADGDGSFQMKRKGKCITYVLSLIDNDPLG